MHSQALHRVVQLVGLGLLSLQVAPPTSANSTPAWETALASAGENAEEWRRAIQAAPPEQRTGVRFLVENMPDRDLTSLDADYLLENTAYAYQAWQESPWRDQVDEALFLDAVLPYASINERRDSWRKDFYERFKPFVAEATSPGEAAVMLNQTIWKQLGVKYSTKRQKADQSPYETIQSGLASCTGLSVLLIDACRSVGVPARFVGTPLWSDFSGNHSWVEVWDGQRWRFTGAFEPTGKKLDKGWFVDRASRAKRDTARHAIYATTFRRTPLSFPCVWDFRIKYIPAVNVTDRYTNRATAVPDGMAVARFCVLDSKTRERIVSNLSVRDANGQTLFTASTKDERFDKNDHLEAILPADGVYQAVAISGGSAANLEFNLTAAEQLVTLEITQPPAGSDDPVEALRAYLQSPADERAPIAEQAFAAVSITKGQAATATELLWADHVATIRATRQEEMDAEVLQVGDKKLRFSYKVFGEKPEGGRSLFISMHGGGGAPPALNDRQWQNQKRLYKPDEGVYLAPRAPTDTWDLWHQAHVDRLFDRLIENLIVFEHVNPDRVYVMGYSAGGDGTYQLAPRMADRWAAAAMMAGHPNDASPLSLRNIGFALYMGGNDGAYKRNEVAAKWKEKLAKLAAEDPGGYDHLVTIYPGKGHWMDGEDASALPWLAERTRDPRPTKIVWRQDDVMHQRFYWLALPKKHAAKPRATVTATREGQQISVDAKKVSQLTIRLADDMLDLDQAVTVIAGGETLYEETPQRTIATMAKSLTERGDPRGVYPAEIEVTLLD